jgi:hypothetical protein
MRRTLPLPQYDTPARFVERQNEKREESGRSEMLGVVPSFRSALSHSPNQKGKRNADRRVERTSASSDAAASKLKTWMAGTRPAMTAKLASRSA